MNNNNKNNTGIKNNSDQDVEVFNDQLGENASEEYKSEEYSNSLQNKNKNKGIK
jgi:hypothetical protein